MSLLPELFVPTPTPDRYKGLIVTFERDLSEEQAKQIAAAIKLLRDVADVAPRAAKPVPCGCVRCTTTVSLSALPLDGEGYNVR